MAIALEVTVVMIEYKIIIQIQTLVTTDQTLNQTLDTISEINRDLIQETTLDIFNHTVIITIEITTTTDIVTTEIDIKTVQKIVETEHKY